MKIKTIDQKLKEKTPANNRYLAGLFCAVIRQANDKISY
ncbi:hypothetical protein J702_2716 [Acinetobacter baumannii 730795]|nr:hypothetical protein J702_2716 [Acinetobacter baumannii 730795]